MICCSCCFGSTDGSKERGEESASSLTCPGDKLKLKTKQPGAKGRSAGGASPKTTDGQASQIHVIPKHGPPSQVGSGEHFAMKPTAITAESLISPKHLDKVKKYDELVQQYRVVKKLSSGTCAVVLLGLQGATGRHVAIKRQEKKGRQVTQIVREAEIHFNVSGHSNIATLLEMSEGPTEIILVQEYCGGGELFDAVMPEIGCAPNVARSFIVQLLDAMHYLHETCKVVHRDIKPENLMLTADKRTLKMIDFGLAEPIQGPWAKYKRRVGTVPYMDPSLWAGRHDDPYCALDVKAIDVWAAGVVLFCMLCGRFPWAEATQRSTEFRKYMAGDLNHFPWNRLSQVHLSLLRGMLHPVSSKRFTVAQAREHVEAYWAVITPAEHKTKIRKDLKLLANGVNNVSDVVTSRTRGSIVSPLTISPVPNVNSTTFDFDTPHIAAC